MSFSPNIVGFACQWCTYAGADLAGNLRCKYPPSVKLIRVPCSGRVEPAFIIDALSRGADAVFVGGCHFGDCHYKEGNYKAARRMAMTAAILAEIGFEPERFRLEWISGAEGRKFAEVMNEYTETLTKLGPSPLNAKAPDPEEGTVKVSMNGEGREFPAGTTVEQAMIASGLDYVMPRVSEKVANIHNPDCPALTLVEVDGRLIPAKLARGTRVKDGMVINTTSEAMNQKLVERLDWLDCKDNCRLIQHIQEVVACEAANSGFLSLEERGNWKAEPWVSAPSVMYDPALCVRCENCVDTCNNVQKVEAIHFDPDKGVVMTDEGKCVRCGQCIHACPVGRESDEVKVFKKAFGCTGCAYSRPLGAIREMDDVDKVAAALRDPQKFVVVQFAPSIRASIGEEFGMTSGSLVTGKLYSALKHAGFDRVWDTNFSADLTILEEGTELILRLVKAGVLSAEGLPVQVDPHTLEHIEQSLPQFTSCSPGWIKFCETFYPDLIPNLSSAKSPQQMFGAVAKTYAAKHLGIDPDNVVMVSIMPCTAKKFECAREEFTDAAKHWSHESGASASYPDVDFVLTTREAGKLLKLMGVDLPSQPDIAADPLIGQYTGAATIFGRTGGVMEAALRTAYEILTGQSLPNLEFYDLGTLDGVKRACVNIAGKEVKVAVAHGLANCRTVCDSVRTGGEFKDYQFIEFMCCPGGCIGGGGQPIPTNLETVKARTGGLNADDRNQALRKSHENPEVLQIYADFLTTPVSSLAHHLLHTGYVDRSGAVKSEA